MKLNYLLMLLLTFMLGACATSPVSPFQPPPPEKPHATVQTTMTDNGFFHLDTPTVSIMTINGQVTDTSGDTWRLHPSNSFFIPAGDSFIEINFGAERFGYTHFYAKKDENYTISNQQEPHHGFRLTVTDSQQRQVDIRTFGGCDSTTSYDNENALLDAIAANDAKEVQRLLQAAANPNLLSPGPDPLPLAALENNLEITQLLIAAGTCVNTVEGAQALMKAVKNGNLEIAQVLLDNGADINLRVWYRGNSTLMEAAQNGQLKMVKLLLQNGAYVKFRNSKGKTALDLAEEAGYQEITDFIGQHAD